MNLKIVLNDNSLWGTLQFRRYIIEKLIDEGHEIIIIAPHQEFGNAINTSRATFKSIKLSRISRNPFNDVIYLVDLIRLYKEYRPDLVINFTIKPNIYGTSACKLLNIPCISVVTGLGYAFEGSSLLKKLIQRLYVSSLNRSSFSFFLNEENYLRAKMAGFTSYNKYILPGGEGIDISNIKLSDYPETPQIVFLMVSRVLYDKGYNEFVEAARANPSARFKLIGALDRNPNAVPEELILKERSIEYLGFMSHNDVLNEIKLAHCVVLPSYHEGMSMTLMEAAAIGRPIICSNIAGCKEMVEENVNGYKVEVKNGRALALACLKFCDLTLEEKKTMGNSSRKIAESKLDIKKVYDIYKCVIYKLFQEVNAK